MFFFIWKEWHFSPFHSFSLQNEIAIIVSFDFTLSIHEYNQSYPLWYKSSNLTFEPYKTNYDIKSTKLSNHLVPRLGLEINEYLNTDHISTNLGLTFDLN